MLRLVLRAGVPVVGVLWLIVALIHQPPAVASTLRQLISNTCADPCVLGVQPGTTTLTVAEAVLAANPAVRSMAYTDDFSLQNIRSRIDWELVEGDAVVRGRIYFENYVARGIVVFGVPLADVWLALGPPDGSRPPGQNLTAAGGNVLSIPVMHTAYYTAHDMRVDAPTTCATFWWEDAQIYVAPNIAVGDPYATRETPPVAQYRQRACAAVRRNGIMLNSAAFLRRLPEAYARIVNG
jgi:hypothetical protein